MKKVILGFMLLVLTGLANAETVDVQEAGKCSTVVLKNSKTGELVVATTTCPSSQTYPGTVTKVFPNGKTTVLQNGQIVSLE